MGQKNQLSPVKVLTYGLNRKCVDVLAKCCLGKTHSESQHCHEPEPGKLEIRHPTIHAFDTLFEYGDEGLRMTFPTDLGRKILANEAIEEAEGATTVSREELISFIIRREDRYRATNYHPIQFNCIQFSLDLTGFLRCGLEVEHVLTKFRSWNTTLANIHSCVTTCWEKSKSCATNQGYGGWFRKSVASPIYYPLPKTYGSITTGRLILVDMFPWATKAERSNYRDQLTSHRGEKPEKMFHPFVDVHGFFIDVLRSGIQLVGSMDNGKVELEQKFDTDKTAEEVQEWVYSQRHDYNYRTFDYATKNCTTFALEFCKFLGVPDDGIPWKLELQRFILGHPENAPKVRELSTEYETKMREQSKGRSGCYS